jgi:hypothetical protein
MSSTPVLPPVTRPPRHWAAPNAAGRPEPWKRIRCCYSPVEFHPRKNTVHPVSASGAVWLERVLPKLKKLRTVSTVAHGIPGPTNEPADQKAQEISPLTVIQYPPLRRKTLPGPVRSESAK